jgi:hypothetical protein
VQLKTTTLIAGPWVGEFGWELFCWHAYIRSLSQFYDKTVCISTPHSKFLYEDFCSQFVEFTPTTGDYKDSFYKVGFTIDGPLMNKLIEKSGIDLQQEKATILTPRRIGDPPRTHFTQEFKFGQHIVAPTYKRFGSPNEKENNLVIVHARNRSLRPADNWPKEKWEILVDLLKNNGYNVISIGLKKESMHIAGSIDRRECEQQQLLDTLASAECIFGPSSGAMHLATLCGCPQVVWTTDYNLDRYTKNWNPFGVPVLFLSQFGWQPKPDFVYQSFTKWRIAENERNSA